MQEKFGCNLSPLVIAELGINHSGSFTLAQDLIRGAQKHGVNAIKFQYRNLNRTYVDAKKEIGDSIINSEINRNFLSIQEIMELAQYAHDRNLYVGISFFTSWDIKDFSSQINCFDFYKVPSPELTNLDLIYDLLNLQKYVLISTGAHNENEIEDVLSRLPDDGWSPMHCVSNYPTVSFNAKLGYIKYLQKKWNKPVGYSSHDEDWYTVIAAIALGVKFIERHITIDKQKLGLDHSSSSTFEEFSKICEFAKDSKNIFEGDSPRIPNQGELINLQNLGRSFYAQRDIAIGEIPSERDFEYRSPRIGLGFKDFQDNIGKATVVKIQSGQALTQEHYAKALKVPRNVIDFARSHKISLPVRLHDYFLIKKELPTGFFEFHLSYSEVQDLDSFNFVDSSDTLSVHLPDYVNEHFLLDPFSSNKQQRNLSLKLINKVSDLICEYQLKNQKRIILVGSFSSNYKSSEDFFDQYDSKSDADFYNQHENLYKRLLLNDVKLCFQWLPPFAWYFGGSHRMTVFNQLKDCNEISKRQLPVCLDTSHLILGANFFGFDPFEITSLIGSNIVHSHISDAMGRDGEGMQFGSSSKSNTELILNLVDKDVIKVIEVWQGHSNAFRGFKESLIKVKELYESR